MEKNLEKVLEDIFNTNGVTGFIVSDKQGLCLGSRGNTNQESSGILTAIAECAKKIHPDEPVSTTILENNDKQCIIQSNEKLVVSIYKNLPA